MALKIPLSELQQLFRRMVFNVVFNNIDDHLKNHSFMHHSETDQWHLAPAYDLTYALNPKVKFHKVSRALSINGKREQITRKDLLKIADTFSIEQAEQIIREIQEGRSLWSDMAYQNHLLPTLITTIQQQMLEL